MTRNSLSSHASPSPSPRPGYTALAVGTLPHGTKLGSMPCGRLALALRPYIPWLGLLLLIGCGLQNTNSAGGGLLPPTPAHASPSPPADVLQQAGTLNIAAKTDLDAALLKVKELEAQIGLLNLQLRDLEGQVGGFNLRIGDVTITTTGWGLAGIAVGGGGLVGLLLYFASRYSGLRPSSPEQREDKANGVKVVKAVDGGTIMGAVCPLCEAKRPVGSQR